MNFDEIRSRFVNYYSDLGFQLLPRAPLLHPSIPMSYVMSAGLVQVETSLAEAQNRTGDEFVLVQKCFRHFDLDTVGTDGIHLSLFEMPGAFVFGSNGTQQAIGQMWRLATEELSIDMNRIWASYFDGGSLAGQRLPQDELTRRTWLDIGLPEARLVGLGIEHNYWTQGGSAHANGESRRKCGPNTELFYDRGVPLSCGAYCRPGCECGRFVEFANLLFISHELDFRTDRLAPIADPFNETVIGTERVAMILQGVESVFDTENYRPIVNIVHQFAGCKNLPADLVVSCERVIADYLRALCVLVADGAPPPGKNGRERIIKLLIRGVLTRKVLLGINSKTFLSTLIGAIMVTLENGDWEAAQTEKKVKEYFATESRRFERTMQRCRRELEMRLAKNQGATLSGSQMLFLEKNHGLPPLLAEMILQEKGLAFPEIEYKEALKLWRRHVPY